MFTFLYLAKLLPTITQCTVMRMMMMTTMMMMIKGTYCSTAYLALELELPAFSPFVLSIRSLITIIIIINIIIIIIITS